MKTKKKKGKSIMEELRAIRDQMGREMMNMSPKEIIDYINKKPAFNFPKATSTPKFKTVVRKKTAAKPQSKRKSTKRKKAV